LREELLTVEDVTKWLKVNPQTVRNWVDRGALGALHVGPRRVRIRQSEVDRFLAAGETHAAATGGDGVPGEPDALAAALTDALRATRAEDSSDLASALRTLASVAERLAAAPED